MSHLLIKIHSLNFLYILVYHDVKLYTLIFYIHPVWMYLHWHDIYFIIICIWLTCLNAIQQQSVLFLQLQLYSLCLWQNMTNCLTNWPIPYVVCKVSSIYNETVNDVRWNLLLLRSSDLRSIVIGLPCVFWVFSMKLSFFPCLHEFQSHVTIYVWNVSI